MNKRANRQMVSESRLELRMRTASRPNRKRFTVI